MLTALQRWWHAYDVRRRVQRHGWTATYVGNYDAAPSWAYSIGFDETLDQPEIIVFDIPLADAQGLFWHVFEDLKAKQMVLQDGAEFDGFQGAVWRKVHPSQIDNADAWLGAAARRREARTGRSHGLEAFQLVLPDEGLRLPWQEGYNERLRMKQPALYLPAEDYGDVPLSPGDREALRVAVERGWSLRLIDAPLLKWAYSIGFADLGLPELISFLPSVNVAANILHEAQAYLARGDLVLEDGLRWNGLEIECCWRRVDESQYLALNVFFLTKLRHEKRSGKREALEAYQLFLPDQAGQYPWEQGCQEQMRRAQPLLFEPFDPEQLKRGPLAALMRM